MRATPRQGKALARLSGSLLLGCALTAAAPVSLHASLREFESWQVEATEQDDENTLDALMRDYPLDWNRAWARTPSGFRTSMGCVTTELWDYKREIKARAGLGRWLEARYDQLRDRGLGSDFDDPVLSLWLHLPAGAPGAGMGGLSFLPRLWGVGFRPAFEKAVMAFEFAAATAPDTVPHLGVRVSFEDVWNSQFRARSSVGDDRVLYLSNPVEYEAFGRIPYTGRGELEVRFKRLTPSSREVRSSIGTPEGDRVVDLEGWRLQVHSALDLGPGWSVVLDARRRSARTAEAPLGAASLVVAERRSRQEEVVFPTLIRHLGPKAQAWVGVQWRRGAESGLRDPGGAAARMEFESRELTGVATFSRRWRSGAGLEIGVLHDDIRVHRVGDFGREGARFGTRSENRGMLGLEWRSERVWIRVVEGIEFDHEPYPVVLRHDKTAVLVQFAF